MYVCTGTYTVYIYTVYIIYDNICMLIYVIIDVYIYIYILYCIIYITDYDWI